MSDLVTARIFRMQLVPLLALLFISSGYAKGPGETQETSFELSVTPFHQFSANISGGGDFTQSRALLRLGAKRPVSRTATIGLKLKYDIDDYDFSGTANLGVAEPWDDVRRLGVSVPFFARVRNNWSVSVSPSVDWIQERGADNSDSLTYGFTAFALKSFTRKKSIGVGAGVFRAIDDDTDVFPFIAVNWQFNERWRLANPFEAEALGPAGLELVYSFNERWHLGGGGVYRSSRFRLNNQGSAPNGIGENKGFVAFARLRRLVSSGINMDLYAGAIVEGELELKDSNGNDLSSADYDTAPFAAVTFSLPF